MLYLSTGGPGSGKTLSTIEIVHQRGQKEARPVYFSNIQDVTFEDWIELENPENWFDELPDGAIYFCDEFYMNFPKLSPSKQTPDHYQKLAVHRHRGIDFYFVCQGVTQIDNFIKPLVHEHTHFRPHPFKNGSYKYKKNEMMTSPTTKAGRAQAEQTFHPFNKRYYGTYKSAELHTKKKWIPKHYIFFVIALIALLFLGNQVYQIYNKYMTPPPILTHEQKQSSSDISDNIANAIPDSIQFSQQQKPSFDPITAYLPRIDNMPETAPAYDELQRPQDFPRPQCLMNKDRCLCYTQQATLMHNYPDALCRDYVKNGRFDPTVPRRSAENYERERQRGRSEFSASSTENNQGNKTDSYYTPPSTKHFTTSWERDLMSRE